MKLVFISNYIIHHQVPFCKYMQKTLGEGFKFIATIPIEKERLELGYADENRLYDFIVRSYEDDDSYKYAKELIMDADVVIQGGSSTELIKERLENTEKLTFRYIERLFKNGYIRLLSPRMLKSLYNSHTKYRNKNFHLLCAGGYVADDCRLIGAYPEKMYKWGYFPETQVMDIDGLIKNKSVEPIKIMWAGRFIDWKHCEYAIKVAELLKNDGYKFELNIIGNGELLDTLREVAQKTGVLDKYVYFRGNMAPEKVREEMKSSSIYLITSDYNEGWGAVLNESMNSGCAVVASHAAGAVPYLLKDGKNGLIFKSRDINDLYKKIKSLLDDQQFRASLGRNAYTTITEHWNAENAADRFLKLVEEINKCGSCDLFESGPCSKEVPIAQRKMYKRLVKK